MIYRKDNIKSVRASEGILTVDLSGDSSVPRLHSSPRDRQLEFTVDAARELYVKLAETMTKDMILEATQELGAFAFGMIENERLREAIRLLRVFAKEPLGGAAEDALRDEVRAFLNPTRPSGFAEQAPS